MKLAEKLSFIGGLINGLAANDVFLLGKILGSRELCKVIDPEILHELVAGAIK